MNAIDELLRNNEAFADGSAAQHLEVRPDGGWPS